jgi:hypothetical protein
MSQTKINKEQFNDEVELALIQTAKLLAIYQSGNRDFEYEVSEEAKIKTALFALEELLK